MGKRWARRTLARKKPGCTVAEFLRMCLDFDTWYDVIKDTELEIAALILFS